MQLLNFPILKDNYIWMLLIAHQRVLIIDPGEAHTLLLWLKKHQITPAAVLLTHHHHDHTAGVPELLRAYPGLSVYGPTETVPKGTTCLIRGGECLTIETLSVNTIAVPGHTLGHLAYYCRPINGTASHSAPSLFCGDTLFSGGCGRLFEGSAEQMYHSLQRLAALPAQTQICCGHEYTQQNLLFARHLSPNNTFLMHYQQKIAQLRTNNQPTLPSNLAIEKKINPFLRCHDISLQQKLGFTVPPVAPWQVFAKLRRYKDQF